MKQPRSDDSGRVMSIQSHVVHGYVGNKSAVFPLQLLGMDVDPINSVQFSNHTGYSKFTGRRLTGEELHELLDGMEANGILQDAHTHLLTGYIGSTSLLDAIVHAYERLRAAQTHPARFVYVCDPVMGDLGKLYVPKELVDLYRFKVLPICDVLTPNHYECELLAEMKLHTVADAMRACKKIHLLGPKVVVITSFQEASREETPTELVVIGSKVSGEDLCEQYEVRFPLIDSYYTGIGDLFAALLLAWLYRFPNNFKSALETVVSTIQEVLQITLQSGGKNCELKLIASRHVIVNPNIQFVANPLAVPVLHVLVDVDFLLGTTSTSQVVDVPSDASILRLQLLRTFESLVGVQHVSIVTNYTVSSTLKLLDQIPTNGPAWTVLSFTDILPMAIECCRFNCKTLVVTSSTTLSNLASRAMYQITPEPTTEEAILTYIKERKARCRLC
ncbi:hypothetical protein CCR75_002544 [Bremia lactucae]|uniref:pyridoxal kinase n=1 Tax=Bremia lactucae TaxID=4779 RepID=A0A976FM10_BRELC|nr:hypothetical protein CCR75_002544 [Bremia lactucae]